ncbi:hypothetical protein AB751O23_DK_00020 [Chlamydiales bacterium SCGC AB-751-O23]|nr:hypothetical protein AB751O23_DK_00020 [Chlamydiales bacterium SCGC AB-751-O23]
MFSVSNLDGDQTPYQSSRIVSRNDLGPVLGSNPTGVYKGISSIGEDKRSSAFRKEFQIYEEDDLKRELQKKVLAKDIMSHPAFTLTLDASFDDFWDALVVQKFKHIPVVSKEDKVLGMLSDKSLLGLLKVNKSSPEKAFDDLGIKGIMRHPVVSCAESTDIHHLAQLMVEERVRALTVVKMDKLVGLITRSDILRCLTYTKPLDIFL